MFEVDLLLPFLNQQQKRHFIKQFLEVRQQKQTHDLERKAQKNVDADLSQENEDIYSGKQFKKFSFNSRQNRPFDEYESQPTSYNNNFQGQSSESSPNQNQIQNYNEMIGQITAQFNYHQIEQQQKQDQHDDRLKYDQIDSMIAKRLKMAIQKIQNRKERGKEKEFPKMSNDDYSKQEQSIIDQISNPSFNNTQNFSQSKQLTFSEYIKQDQIHSSPNSRENHPHYQNNQEQNYASLRKPYMQIDQEPEEEDYEPLFKKNQYNHINLTKNEKNKKFTSFEEYTKQLATKNEKKKTNKIKQTIPIQSKTKKNQVVTAKTYQSTKLNTSENNKAKQTKNWEARDKQTVNSQVKRTSIINPTGNRERAFSKNSNHSHSNQKKSKESPISKESRRLKNQLQEFLEEHKKKLSKIYVEIKQRISDRQHQGNSQYQQINQKQLQKFYILVQDDFEEFDRELDSIPEQSQNSEFKQQMLKDYHNEILVNNRNLSSEELVKYFKFLHSNAKKLYIKYLQNKNK